MSSPRMVEGVPYYRHVVLFTLRDGRRRRLIHWSPGMPWIREEVARGLDERIGLDNIKPRSVRIEFSP